MSEHGFFSPKEEIKKLHPERKEGAIDSNLKIARLISPTKLDHKIALMVGIPFEENQLEGLSIEVAEERIPLIRMMEDLDLLGETEGVPHLSVGGKTKVADATLDSSASRSYLTNEGYSIQGTGLVKYEREKGQVGFGLDMPFVRSGGEKDVGGGIYKLVAIDVEDTSEKLWLTSLLDTGEANFARVMKIFNYQEWLQTQQTGLVIREDGRRGVPRKQLSRAIHDSLPSQTDFFHLAADSFSTDGHNAFQRDGKVIFTDYETFHLLDPHHEDFMDKLASTWYFEELRKRYPDFLKLYDLQETGRIDYTNIDSIEAHLSKKLSDSTYDNAEVFDKISDDIAKKDSKAVVRYAMAGVIGSRARARNLGAELLSDILIPNIYDSHKVFSLDEALDTIKEADIREVEKIELGDESCKLLKDEDGNPFFQMRINTFGLPIEPTIIIPVTPADIVSCLKGTDYEDLLDLPPQLVSNEFGDLPENLFSNTLYSNIAGALANVKGLESFEGGPEATQERIQGYDEEALVRGRAILSTDIPLQPFSSTFTFGEHIKVTVDRDKLTIDVTNGLKNMSLAELNKIAYTVHTASQYLQAQGMPNNQAIAITQT